MSSWEEAARHYATLDQKGREAYWKQLTPEQQGELGRWLQQAPAASATVEVAKPVSNGSRAASGLFFGCAGFIVGVILTIGVQVAAVIAGIGAIGELFNTGPSISGPGRQSPNETENVGQEGGLNCTEPRSEKEKQQCEDFLHDMQRDLQRREELRKQEEAEHP